MESVNSLKETLPSLDFMNSVWSREENAIGYIHSLNDFSISTQSQFC